MIGWLRRWMTRPRRYFAPPAPLDTSRDRLREFDAQLHALEMRARAVRRMRGVDW